MLPMLKPYTSLHQRLLSTRRSLVPASQSVALSGKTRPPGSSHLARSEELELVRYLSLASSTAPRRLSCARPGPIQSDRMTSTPGTGRLTCPTLPLTTWIVDCALG